MEPLDHHKGENPSILFFLWLTLVLIAILAIGLAWRQLIDRDAFEVIEKRQTERRILKPGPRGDIYDRRGRLLVGNRPHYSAVVYLDDLRPEFRSQYSKELKKARAEIEATYLTASPEARPQTPPLPNYYKLQWKARQEVIQKYLDQINAITGRNDRLTETRLIRHFNENLLLPLPLVRDLTPDQYARLVEQIPPPPNSPIQIHTDTARYYPYHELAAHLLGYVQNKNLAPDEFPSDGIKTFAFQKKVGRSGLEAFFNETLTGTTGSELWRVDPLGFQDTRLELQAPKQGQALNISIDIDLQRAAETTLGNRAGAAVAIDIRTGEILALASHPNYNQNHLSPFIPQKTFDAINEAGAWLNRALQLSYPPGSTFKILTAIAGMRNGSITLDTAHNCRGVYRVGNRIFRCHARNGHGSVQLTDAIEASCNVFFYAEGLDMGIDTLSTEAQRFGFHEKTGIEVPYETSRNIVPTKSWKREKIGSGWVPGDTANTSIGQGFLLATPLQMACFMASVARDETRTQPTILTRSTLNPKPIEHGGEPIGLNPRQRAHLWQGMEQVTGRQGTGRLVGIDNFRIAGKTGTADFRAHGKEVNLAWFIGFAPVEDPQIAVAIMVEGTEESHAYHGGSTAGPIAKDIFLEFIRQYPERAGRLPPP
ncbi:MAG: Peptidoglycan D,D-transpeptidase MrdA [Opitutia bacterium UBA7350]|nr:MAG: Peptidoglycan D,D-transpeptidase MrdA [Opitutae bacterium UBA7350]